jgi:hypothetical protein
MSAGALRRAGNCHRIFPIDFGQEKSKKFQKNFDIYFENSMSKTAIRIQFRRQEKKLGQENQFLQNSRREIGKNMPCREKMQAQAQDQSRKIPTTKFPNKNSW